jgi:mono/diheme cytochrome c family protein
MNGGPRNAAAERKGEGVMKRILRWIVVGFAGVARVAALVGLGGFVASEVMIRLPADAPLSKLRAAHDSGAVGRGRRVAILQGCQDCHGANLEGKLFHDEPALVRAWAPNLTLAAAGQSDAELERAIRHGVAADGRALWIMPSSAFSRLTDAEVSDLIAYVRSHKPAGTKRPRLQVGPIGRLGVLLGKFRSEPQLLRTTEARAPLPDLGAGYAEGRRLARACVECHGPALKGDEGVGSPDLTIATSYELADFERLLRTGVAAGNRRVGMMSDSAPKRFNALTSGQIAELHGYLKARAAREFALQDAATLPKP